MDSVQLLSRTSKSHQRQPRNSRDERNQRVKVLLAAYSDWNKGLYHNPINAYKANGFTLRNLLSESLPIDDKRNLPVRLFTWQRSWRTEVSRGVDTVLVSNRRPRAL